MFSKACEYGIKATIFIIKNSIEGKRSNVNEISKEIDSPISFTAKILQKLVKANVIFSTKGAYGGFEMSDENIRTLNLLRIVSVIDGDDLLSSCVLGLSKCSGANPCPLHQQYTVLRQNLINILNNTSLMDLANSLNAKQGFLKN